MNWIRVDWWGAPGDWLIVWHPQRMIGAADKRWDINCWQVSQEGIESTQSDLGVYNEKPDVCGSISQEAGEDFVQRLQNEK